MDEFRLSKAIKPFCKGFFLCENAGGPAPTAAVYVFGRVLVLFK